MKVAILSDLHDATPQVSDCEVAIFCGDFMEGASGYPDLEKQFWEKVYKPYLEDIRARGIYTVGIPGNHDFLPQRSVQDFRYVANMFDRFLVTGTAIVKGIKIYAFCWNQLEEWAYYMHPVDAVNLVDSKEYPKSVDFLVTHTPPYGILSTVPAWGSPAISLLAKKVKPKIAHVFGHCHGDRGIMNIDGTTYVNAACADSKRNFRGCYYEYDTDSRVWTERNISRC